MDTRCTAREQLHARAPLPRVPAEVRGPSLAIGELGTVFSARQRISNYRDLAVRCVTECVSRPKSQTAAVDCRM